MGHYAAKEIKLKKAITIDSEISPSATSRIGGFQAAFEEDGGCVANKLWAPLGTPDYTPYLAQMTGIDGSARALPVRARCAFMKTICQLRLKYPGGDRRNRRRRRAAARLRRRSGRHDERLPLYARPRHRRNKKFAQAMQKDFNVVPGFYAAGLYVNCQVVEAGLERRRRNDRRQGKFMAAHQGREAQGHAARTDQLRPSRQCRRLLLRPPHRERRRTPTASSSGTRRLRPTTTSASSGPWPEKEFLAHPVYSRNYPPLKKC